MLSSSPPCITSLYNKIVLNKIFPKDLTINILFPNAKVRNE